MKTNEAFPKTFIKTDFIIIYQTNVFSYFVSIELRVGTIKLIHQRRTHTLGPSLDQDPAGPIKK